MKRSKALLNTFKIIGESIMAEPRENDKNKDGDKKDKKGSGSGKKKSGTNKK
jgi:hypothetical protein